MAADVLEIYLADIRRLFNSMDPAPFHERDLDPNAADYIREWAEELPGKGPLALVVKLGTPLGAEDSAAAVERSVRDHFQRRAAATRRNLREMLRMGRYSLLAAMLFLGPVIVIAESAARMVETERYAALIENSLVIRRVGRAVAPARDLSLRLVADPRRGQAVRPAGPDGSAHGQCASRPGATTSTGRRRERRSGACGGRRNWIRRGRLHCGAASRSSCCGCC